MTTVGASGGVRGLRSGLAPSFLLAAIALASCQQRPIEPPAAPSALPTAGVEGSAHGFPEMRTLAGEPLGEGEFTQWLEDGRLQVRIRYDLGRGHAIEERATLRQEPELVQEAWSWREERSGALLRRFTIDFTTGEASAEKVERDELRRWNERLELAAGRAFAGSAFTLAIKSSLTRLLRGEEVELQTVGFTPAPKLVSVGITHAGVERLEMSGRGIEADRFVIHPKIPAVLRAFVDAPDTHLWLVHAPPAAFLRFEGPLAEPGDTAVRVDLLPGPPSATVRPTKP